MPSPSQPMPSRGRRVIVARSDNLGDVLLTGPAARAIAASGAEVHYLCSPQGGPAARLLPGVHSVHVAAIPWIDDGAPPATKAWADELTGQLAGIGAEEAVIFTSFHQSPLPLALLMRTAGVTRISAISVDFPGSLLDVRLTVDEDIHEVERGLSLAAAAGYRLPPGDDRRLRIELGPAPSPPDDAGASGALDQGPDLAPPERYVVVHPGASVPARAWSPEGNAELVDALVSLGRRVVVTGGASEQDLVTRVAGRHVASGRVVDLAGRTDFSQLAAVISRADAVVCGNTGPAHIAAAMGTPVVSIYAPTVPAVRWHPWMVPHVVLGRQDIGCAGCRARVCPVVGHPCVDQLTVESVLAAVDLMSRSDREWDAQAMGAAAVSS